jgi:hypothetical protein
VTPSNLPGEGEETRIVVMRSTSGW